MALYSTVHITEFKHINVCWAWDTVFSDNNFFSITERNILSYGLGWVGTIYWAICYHLYSSSVRLGKEKIFTTVLQNDKSNPAKLISENAYIFFLDGILRCFSFEQANYLFDDFHKNNCEN